MAPVLEELDHAECLRLIAPGGVGRVGFDDGQGPAVLPVNYVVDGDSVVFRTAVEGRLDSGVTTGVQDADVRIAFEVDRFDEDSRQGWSVMLRGGAHHMSPEEAADAPTVDPWPGGERDAHIRLTPRTVTGRRVRQDG
ncbi:pyridoxamine 5'-phosphate oxidase family protein [Actinomadura macrotermitis]|uniref:Pyridoxamine 5'-phosphate oxidase family protein n=1 Tax=Actinomadura macrotermitis TaxID=2585200 RepID=A0A7K0C3L7_9ACTN|nr:pyridoxamine 5'-phosphate oxidase family protein [Actinomadura macrotermitis]MQY08039.1 hypothetical protein [Actinomadura macrotermitis]